MARGLSNSEHVGIINKIRNNDKKALEEYLMYWEPVINRIVNLLELDENIKEDVIQSCFEGVLIGIKKVNFDSKTSPYDTIYMNILSNINKCLGYYLKAYKRCVNKCGGYLNNIKNLIKEVESGEEDAKLIFLQENQSLEEIVVNNEILEIIKLLILTLPEKEKEILCSYYKFLGFNADTSVLAKKYHVNYNEINRKRRIIEKKLKSNYFLQDNGEGIFNLKKYAYYKDKFFNCYYKFEDLKCVLNDFENKLFHSPFLVWSEYKPEIIFTMFVKLLRWEYNFETINDLLGESFNEELLTSSEKLFLKEVKNKDLFDLIYDRNFEYIFGYFIPRLINIKEHSKAFYLKRLI